MGCYWWRTKLARRFASLDHVSGGLTSKAPNGSVGAFAIAGADRKFVWAQARIEGDVFYKALEMHQGAMIAGQLKPLDSDEKPLLKLAANNQ